MEIEIICAQLLSTIMSTVVVEKIGDSDLTYKLVGKLSEKGFKIVEDWLKIQAKKIKGFNLITELSNCGISDDDEVLCFVRDFLKEIPVEIWLNECGGPGENFVNKVIDAFDQKLKLEENQSLLGKIGDKYKNLVTVINKWMKEIWDTIDKDKILLMEIATIKEMASDIEVSMDKMGSTLNKIDKNVCELLERQDSENGNIDIRNLFKEYKNAWNNNLFLDKPKKRAKNNRKPIKLSQMYQLPYYKYYSNSDKVAIKEEIWDDIPELMQDTINADVPEDRMLVILGQPGCGKSSLISWFVNNITIDLESEILVYRFTDFKNLAWNQEDIAKQILDVIQTSKRKRILFLDGFDEIYIGKDGEAVINRLFSGLVKNNNVLSLFITCRENYITPVANNGSKILKCDYIVLQPLNNQQIENYYNAYKKNAGRENMNAVLSVLQKEKDVFGIPIILYMTLATDIKVGEKSTLVDVYDKLFDLQGGGLYDVDVLKDEEHWIWKRQAVDSLEEKKRISRESIHQLSRDIAVWMFHNEPQSAIIPQYKYEELAETVVDRRYIKSSEVGNFFKHCEGIKGNDICFVHRSIYQYFVADAVIDAIKKEIIDMNIEGFTRKIIPFIQNGMIDEAIGNYLIDKVKKLSITNKGAFFEWLENILSNAINKGFLKESDRDKYSFLELMEREANCFSNFIILLRIFSNWNNNLFINGYGRGKLSMEEHIPRMNFIKYIKMGLLTNEDFFKYELSQFDFCAANLSGIDFSGADLSSAYLHYVDFENTNLSDANLNGADLTNAHMRGAVLTGASIIEADLRCSDLSHAKLNLTNLEKADLKFADLSYACLDCADLTGADLSWADLRGTSFDSSNFDNVNMSGAAMYANQVDGLLKEYLRKKGVQFVEN